MAHDRFIDVAGLHTRYFEEGSGAPVLLLHGAALGSSADVWAGNLPRFAARGLRTIAVDLPGFGLTDNPDDSSVGFRMRFVPQFLAALRLERAHLVAHSQSGRIAVSLGLDRPECVSRIVVLGTASLLPPLPGAGKEAGEGDEDGSTQPTLEDTRRLLEANLFNPALATPAAVALRQRMSTGKNFAAFVARREARAGERKQKEDRPLWQRLSEVRVPMRLIYGMQDRAAGQRAALAKELHPALDLHLVDRCGHLVQWDAPDALDAIAGGFLEKDG